MPSSRSSRPAAPKAPSTDALQTATLRGSSAPLLAIDSAARTVTLAGKPVSLTGRAFDLLTLLASQPGRVFSASELTAAAWPGRVVEDGNLRVQVNTLRKQLGAALVVNVPGRGYVLAAATHPSLGRTAGNLPRAAEALLGREAELAALQAMLAEHRLVTVLGAGGIGKTRLAQQAAMQWQARSTGIACWVDLALLQAADTALAAAVTRAVARAVGVQLAPPPGSDAVASLGQALTDWQGLVLLDNAEHLAAPLAAWVRTLLAWVPGLRVLVTSQQALKLPEEWVYPLNTLAVPAPNALPEQARACAAVQLMVERATAADHRYVLSDADLPAVAAVVRRLDGIALAIEMAAARLPLLGAAALEKLLGARLHLFGGDGNAALPRHRTLRAALDWSVDLLLPVEQAALRQLSVFIAPFRLESAQRVVVVQGHDEWGVMQAVQGLVDKSLVQVQHAASADEPRRLRLLESTRLHALEALSRNDDLAGAQARHAQAMAAVAVLADADYSTASDKLWRLRWGTDQEDLWLAFDRACDGGDAESAARLIGVLTHLANVNQSIDRFVACARRMPALLPLASPRSRALLLNAAMSATDVRDEQLAMLTERVQLWRDLGDRQQLCRALSSRALLLGFIDDTAGSAQMMLEAQALCDPSWPVRTRFRCFAMMWADSANLRNDSAALCELLPMAAEALQVGALPEASTALGEGVLGLRLQGRQREALNLLGELVAVLDAERSLDLLWYPLAQMCAVSVELAEGPPLDRERLAQACRYGERALRRPLAGVWSMAYVLEPLALLSCRMGDAATGATLLAGGDRMRRDHGYSCHAMNARAAALVRQEVAQRLTEPARAAAEAAGSQLQDDELRRAAWAWLQRQVAALPSMTAPTAEVNVGSIHVR